jgi:hypothetical protein
VVHRVPPGVGRDPGDVGGGERYRLGAQSVDDCEGFDDDDDEDDEDDESAELDVEDVDDPDDFDASPDDDSLLAAEDDFEPPPRLSVL